MEVSFPVMTLEMKTRIGSFKTRWQRIEQCSVLCTFCCTQKSESCAQTLQAVHVQVNVRVVSAILYNTLMCLNGFPWVLSWSYVILLTFSEGCNSEKSLWSLHFPLKFCHSQSVSATQNTLHNSFPADNWKVSCLIL